MKLMGSISSFGLITPILVDVTYQVIAGHVRLEAAKRLGFREVSTIQVDHLSEAQKRAFIIADNKLGELLAITSVTVDVSGV